MEIDKSISEALADSKTTDVNSNPIIEFIDGVKVANPVVHNDHRGRVFEIYSRSTHVEEFWSDPIVYCYAFTIRSGQIKGWGLHEEKSDRYTLIKGEVLTILYDSRTDSPTHGKLQKVYLGEQGSRMLLIPPGVWHMNINLAEEETLLINHPTIPYDHNQPDRKVLNWDTDLIPINLRDYFPISRT